MCGIIALYLNQEQSNIEEILNAYMMLTNRGPDSGNWSISKDKITGFRRLAIMDNSTNGEQPFKINEDILMCNGEIFNHKELIKKYNLDCKSKALRNKSSESLYLPWVFAVRALLSILSKFFKSLEDARGTSPP